MTLENQQEIELAVRKAGEILLKYWKKNENKDLDIETKSDGSSVTKADYESNDFLVSTLKRLYPDCGIYSEELKPEANLSESKRIWMIDPLDGTQSFIDGNDDFSILLTLCEDQKPIYAIMYFPAQELFCVSDNEKFLVNGKEVKVSDSEKIRNESIYIRKFDPIDMSKKFPKWIDSGRAFLKVASGDFDGAILKLAHHQEWDFAGATLAIEKSGGKVTDREGKPLVFKAKPVEYDYYVASNGIVHEELLKLIPENNEG